MNEILQVLKEATGSSNAMDQPNEAGKTPRQLRDDTQHMWEEQVKRRLSWETRVKSGFGRGSGRPRKPN